MSDNKKMDQVVYLVDDDFAVLDSLSLLIQTKGYRVNSFLSAQEFLAAYDNNISACLILDVRIPDMSGLELQDNLLANKYEIPIIFISGQSKVIDSAKAFRSGAIDFLEKPFDNQILLERIEEALKKDSENRAKNNQDKLIQQRIESLTVKEKDVLMAIIKGCSNKEIAIMMDISHRTIEVHRARLMKKMQVHSFSELIVLLNEILVSTDR